MSSDIRLSERLKRICDMCGRGNVIADIGCDHGFTSITLVKSGAYKKALAMDVRKGPLERAVKNIREAGLADHIETRLSDGFEKLKPGEADASVITGMGGELIESILNAYPDTVKKLDKLILSPQSEAERVRRTIRELGFGITDEDALYDDGKYYEIIVAENANKVIPADKIISADKVVSSNEKNGDMRWSLSPEELSSGEEDINEIYGPVLLAKKNPALKKRLEEEKTVNEKLLLSLENESRTESVTLRIADLKSKLSHIDTALNMISG